MTAETRTEEPGQDTRAEGESEPVLLGCRDGHRNPALPPRILPLGIYHTGNLTQGYKGLGTRLLTVLWMTIIRKLGEKASGQFD